MLRETKPGLVTFYDIRSRNGVGRSILTTSEPAPGTNNVQDVDTDVCTKCHQLPP